MKRQNYIVICIILLFLLVNLIIDIIVINQVRRGIEPITKEDGIIEYAQAIFYFLSACLLFILFIKSKAEKGTYVLKAKRNLFFLLICLICLFAAGEEISWGQRIFNIETGDFFYEHNEQKETNIHNLRLFQGKVDGSWKKGLAYLLNGQYIAYYFLFGLLFVIPLLNRYFKRIRIFLAKIYFPITPLWIAFMLILTTIICETIKYVGLIGYFQIGEIKEANYAALLFSAILSIFLNYNESYRAISK